MLDPRRRRLVAGGAALLAAAAVAAAAWLVPDGRVRYTDPPVAYLSLAPPVEAAATAPAPETALPARLRLTDSALGAGPPAALDPDLVERTAAGDLPRRAADGRTPLAHYARPARGACVRSCVSVLITGLGLADRITGRALALPEPVALSFSPYAGAAAWQARARAAGHETFLALPLAPAPRSPDEAGPRAIRPDAELALAEATLRVLAEGAGYVGLDAVAGGFTDHPTRFGPVAAALAGRGLGFVEIGGAALEAVARGAGLAYLATGAPVDEEPLPEAIDRSLAAIVAEARQRGWGLAVAGPTPASLERIAAWITTLPALGVELVPPSALLLRGAAPPALAGP